MESLKSTYRNYSYPTIQSWTGNGMCFEQEQVKPNDVTFIDNKHRKSVQLQLKDDIVQEIDY